MPPCTRARRDEANIVPAGLPGNDESGDDIRRQLVFDEGDAVAQVELALLEALNLDDVGAGRRLQRRDRGVEVAMLLLKARKLRPKLAFFLFRHRRLGRAAARSGHSLRAQSLQIKSIVPLAYSWSMILSKKTGFPPRIKSGAGFFRILFPGPAPAGRARSLTVSNYGLSFFSECPTSLGTGLYSRDFHHATSGVFLHLVV
jgi:hypothetical protein